MLSDLYHIVGRMPATRSLGLMRCMLRICCMMFAMPRRLNASSFIGITTSSAATSAAADAALNAGGQSIIIQS